MELKNIKELMAAMGKMGMKRLRLKQEHFELELEREGSSGQFESHNLEFQTRFTQPQEVRSGNGRAADIPPSLHLPGDLHNAAPKELPGNYVKSPMVGTFYATSGPDEPPFVKPGDVIDKDTVVCIVEAMKVMNEVKAGVAGTVAEILIENSHPVEFGTRLFRII